MKLALGTRVRVAAAALFKGKSYDWGDVNGALFPGSTSNESVYTAGTVLRAYTISPWLRMVASRVMQVVGSTEWYLVAGTTKPGKDGRRRIIRDIALQRAPFNQRNKMMKERRKAGTVTDEITDHPGLTAIHGSPDAMAGSSSVGLANLYIDLIGESFWLKERDSSGTVIRYWPIPPTWVQSWIISTPTTDYPHFDVMSNVWRGPIRQEDLLWSKTVDPQDPYRRGSGLGAVLGNEIGTDEAAAEHTEAYFRQGALPPVIVSGAGSSKTSDMERLERRWIQKTQGFLRKHMPFFLNNNVKIHELSSTFDGDKMATLRKFERDATLQVWGAAPETFGIIENSNRSTIDAADYMFSKYVIAPRLEFFRKILQREFEQEYDPRLVVMYRSPIEEDKAYNLEVAAANPPALLLDEWREMQGRLPLENDAGQVIVIPRASEIVKVGDIGKSRASVFASADGCGHEHKETSRPFELKTSGEEILDVLEGKVPGLQKEILEAFDALRELVDIPALEAAISSQDAARVAEILNPDTLGEEFIAVTGTIQQAFGIAGDMAAEALSEYLGIELSFDITNPYAVTWLEGHAAEFVTSVDEVTRAGLAEAITDAFASEQTPPQAAKTLYEMIGLDEQQAKATYNLRARLEAEGILSQAEIEARIAKYIEKQRRYRAWRMAQNEMNTASNQGQLSLWEQAADDGLLDKSLIVREWIVTPDDRLCELCAPMDGARTSLNGTWSTATGLVTIPTEIHVLCRCTQRIVILDRTEATL